MQNVTDDFTAINAAHARDGVQDSISFDGDFGAQVAQLVGHYGNRAGEYVEHGERKSSTDDIRALNRGRAIAKIAGELLYMHDAGIFYFASRDFLKRRQRHVSLARDVRPSALRFFELIEYETVNGFMHGAGL